MPKTVSARLRPYRQGVGFRSHRNRLYCSARRIDRVDHLVESSGKPQKFAVGADIAHVRTSTAWDRPGLFDFTGGEINYGHAPSSMRCALAHMCTAIRDIQFLSVTAWIQTMRAASGGNESSLFECLSVDKKNAVGFHIGNEEDFSVGCASDVLRHAVLWAGLRGALSH